MNALFSVIATVVILTAFVAHCVHVLWYARSDEWKIQQRLQRYAGR